MGSWLGWIVKGTLYVVANPRRLAAALRIVYLLVELEKGRITLSAALERAADLVAGG
jgi:hypothetical protein